MVMVSTLAITLRSRGLVDPVVAWVNTEVQKWSVEYLGLLDTQPLVEHLKGNRIGSSGRVADPYFSRANVSRQALLDVVLKWTALRVGREPYAILYDSKKEPFYEPAEPFGFSLVERYWLKWAEPLSPKELALVQREEQRVSSQEQVIKSLLTRLSVLWPKDQKNLPTGAEQ